MASYEWNSEKCVLGVFCDFTKASVLTIKKNWILWYEGFTFKLVWFLSRRKEADSWLKISKFQ